MTHSHQVVARLRGAGKSYGAQRALDGIDLELRAGEVLALLGPNGAGKSTATGLLLGLLAADQGEAEALGQPAGSRAARLGTGAMLQAAGIPDRIKVGELLALVRSYYPDPRATAECVAMAGMEGLLGRRYGQLSGGQQRRVQFALAICGRPRLLCLDEPTTGLDIEARQGLWAAIRAVVAEGSAVLLTTHYLEEAEALANRVAVIDRGRLLAEGSVAAIREHVVHRRIRCTSELDEAMVARWPGVLAARREHRYLQLDVASAEPVLRRLLQADPGLHDLEVQRAGLADAFLELTRQPEAA